MKYVVSLYVAGIIVMFGYAKNNIYYCDERMLPSQCRVASDVGPLWSSVFWPLTLSWMAFK